MDNSKLTKCQYLMLFSYALAQFFNATCISLQAPFFPQEAESKGSTATEYGLVFGVFELVMFLICPWYGKCLGRIRPDRMFSCGIMTSAVCSILFGFLHFINDHILFISLAFLIRITEAMGCAAFLTAGMAIIAQEFPNNVASTFASLETFFGLGWIIGPTFGGFLYQIGGFTMPFAILGICLLICAVLTRITLPNTDKYQRSGTTTDKVWKILRIKGMLVCFGNILTTNITIGFVSATLEPHIRQFDLSPIQVGLIFIVNGAVYGVTAPAWGWLCDSKLVGPKEISILGGIILIVGTIFLGPAPFIPLQKSLVYIIFGLVLHGISIGARFVSSFTDALQTAMNAGMPNGIGTYGIIFAIWMSSLSLGGFIGPSVAGFLFDHYGFANASLFIILLISIMLIFEFWSLISFRRRKSDLLEFEDMEEQKPLLAAQI